MKLKREEIYLDLSKLSENEIKKIHFILRNKDENIHTATARDLINGIVTHCYWFLFFDGNAWNQNETPLSGRTELPYPEFIKLFEGGESDGWIKIKNEKDLPKEDILYWVVKNGEVVDMENWELTLNFHNKRGVTHYQPIQKPLPPLH